jgi:HK97 family phage major capsid protein
MTIDELRERRDRLTAELEDLRTREQSAGVRTRIADTDTALTRVNGEIATAEARLVAMRRQSERGHSESGDVTDGGQPDRSNTMSTTTTPRRIRGEGVTERRDAALRSVDAAFDRGAVDEPSGARLIDLVNRDKTGVDADYLAAVSDAVYERAFSRMLMNPTPGAQSLLSTQEQEAVQRVGEAMAQRGLAVGEGAAGGFAIPLSLDPTVQLTDGGTVSPLRELADVASITTTEWAGITSAGVSASFAAEGTEVEDSSPELAQPKIKPERAHGFVPFTIEAGADWSQVQAELARLFQDEKANLEATKFLTGDGEDEPYGILTGATELVETAEKGKYAVGDVYKAQEALPPRWQPNASWLTSLTIANTTARFSGPGGEEPPLFNDARDRLLMKPWRECSDMDTAVADGKLIALYGDVRAGFKIVDRIGASVELVPHLFGEEGRPKGERGIYFYWRVGSKVVNKAALRVLKVKAS